MFDACRVRSHETTPLPYAWRIKRMVQEKTDVGIGKLKGIVPLPMDPFPHQDVVHQKPMKQVMERPTGSIYGSRLVYVHKVVFSYLEEEA
ncbi:MAG: hypothetical protein GWO20_16715 [Candidatus Korarchaeota archaeon]|nr:hypothetical protein [Candidatus Korarchaeota archaeon]NIW15071.1 hypothetical protein [Candidatus Thorarchaeota archaeon]NIW53081.1 hypothetical protein [Candidatus Korarchaeota archaeon]